MSLKIVHYNDPVLRRKGEKITVFDASLGQLAKEMIETMHEAKGIGLAAQQVGHAIQFCVVDLRTDDPEFTWELDGARPPLSLFMPMAIANPVIKIVAGTEDFFLEEGCLSFPGIRGDVLRPDAIVVNFQDEQGVPHVLKCDDLLSRCIQHETDHLNGVLFVDRMQKKVRNKLGDAIKALEQQTKDEAVAASASPSP